MSSYQRAVELAEKLKAEGINATADSRAATPPCVLVEPPNRTYDVACGYTAQWSLMALVPGPFNADAHKLLDELGDAVAGVLDVRTMTRGRYPLSNDTEAVPAYRIEFEEAITWP